MPRPGPVSTYWASSVFFPSSAFCQQGHQLPVLGPLFEDSDPCCQLFTTLLVLIPPFKIPPWPLLPGYFLYPAEPIIGTAAYRNSHLVFPQQVSLLFSELSAHNCSPRMFCPDVNRSTVQIRNQFLLLTLGYLGTGDDLVMSVIQPEVQPCLIPDLI